MFRRKTQSDKEAVLQILAGDREAYVVLVERYLRQVHALAFAKTGNRADARHLRRQD